MILLGQKLSRPFKFPSMMENDRHPNSSDALSASLRNFCSKISNFISHKRPESDQGLLHKCFELINITNRSFAKMMVEIDHPMTRWGERLTDEYLSYTLNLLDLLNYVHSSLSHLSQAKISISHALSLIKISPTSAANHLMKIPRKYPIISTDFKFGRTDDRPGSVSDQKERVVLEALDVSKKTEFLAIGLVLSGLSSDAKPYMEIRKRVGEFEDSLVRELDLKFCTDVMEVHLGEMGEVTKVHSATEGLSTAIISTGSYTHEAVEELKKRLEVVEDSIRMMDKQANNLFSQVLATRNKLLDNLRLTL